MRTPIYQKIEFPDYSAATIMATLNKCGAGEVPLYWLSEIGHREELEKFLKRLHQILDDMQINSKFPYPFYIVTDVIAEHFHFPIISKLEALPAFFNHKMRRLSSKEALMNNKCQLLAEKIRNQSIEDKMRLIQLNANYSREIHLLSEELEKIRKIAQQLDLVRAEKKV
jgi:hypothetical protein